MRLDHLLSKENVPETEVEGIASRSGLRRSRCLIFEVRRDGGIAQLGERLPCKQEVSGSIPLISTRGK